MNGRTLTVVLASGVALAAGVATGGASTSGGSYKLAGTFGKPGTANGQFDGARGIAIAPNGNVYIADSNNNRIQVFSRTGAFRSAWGKTGDDTGQFNVPPDVAVAADGSVWVADDINARAQSFSGAGTYKSTVILPGLESARAVAVSADGDVYVAAEGSGQAGFRVFPGGTSNNGDLLGAGAYSPHDIEVSPDGTVFLVESDSLVTRVQHYTKDGKSLGTFTLPNVSGIGVDSDCNIWAGDFTNRGIAKFSTTGRRLATAAYTDLQAQDIAVAKNGDLYVTQLSGPIVHFTPDRSKTATAAIPSRLTVSKGPSVRIAYTLRGVSCPAQVTAKATLTGPGISGTLANVEVLAGKRNVLTMPLVARSLKTAPASGKATFKITLRTNGRPTVETRTVTVVVPAGVR